VIEHIFPNFLHDERAYAEAERYWLDLWSRVSPIDREMQGWRQPWFQPLPPDVSEGNPIFSAYSPGMRQGIRILQSEPTESGLEFYAYHDTFGGTIDDPSAIHELVISCALSDLAAHHASIMLNQWVSSGSVSFGVRKAAVDVSVRAPRRAIPDLKPVFFTAA